MLGRARDTDVIIENLRTRFKQASTEEQAGIQWLIDRLSAYRGQYQKALVAFLKQIDEEALQRQIVSCLPEGGSE
jgi:CHAD domain-containing protein